MTSRGATSLLRSLASPCVQCNVHGEGGRGRAGCLQTDAGSSFQSLCWRAIEGPGEYLLLDGKRGGQRGWRESARRVGRRGGRGGSVEREAVMAFQGKLRHRELFGSPSTERRPLFCRGRPMPPHHHALVTIVSPRNQLPRRPFI